MSHARIYQLDKSAMQSGRARAGRWVLEHEPAEAKRADPLTGWAGSGDTNGQVRLTFDTLDAARAYAEKAGLTPRIVPAAERVLKIQAYADNFR
ncbi:ETC complex I subunit [Sphingomonas sp. 1P06PA]|uniref:ETC complex I subunit n=1 Tax=Sphingomonas sp. 1P06PA TaxID=554121 RepID=UPI0039A43664